jgi:hypothetical protein
MRQAVGAVAVLVSVALAMPATAQDGFKTGYMDIGPTLGLGNVGSASAAFGGRWEKAIKPLPDFGGGMLGIQVGATYYSWSSPGFGGNYGYTYIPIGVTGNYHFKMENPKLDPFVGLGLGYRIITCDFPSAVPGACSSSAIYFIGRAGGRYFFSPKMAAYADVGAGGASLNLGVMFKLK